MIELSLKIEINLKNLFAVARKGVSNLATSIGIGHLLLLSFALHIFCMSFPSDSMVFDEVHYVKATRAHLEGLGANAEHTPLVKVVMSFIFRVFGDYWFAWRFPIVVSCVVTYLAFYYVAKHFLDEKYALLATAFLCFDTVFFIHGTIYLLDMPAIMFGVLGILCYLRGRYKTSALSMALAILCKEIALFFLVGLVAYAVGRNLRRTVGKLQKLKKSMVYLFVLTLTGVLLISVYDVSYKLSAGSVVNTKIINRIITDPEGNPLNTTVTTVVTTSTKYVANLFDHFKLFWRYHVEWMTNLNMSYRAYQKPWNWIAPFDPKGVLDHPVYYSVKVSVGDKAFRPINWRAQATLPIWYSFWMVVPMCVYQLVTKKETKMSSLLLAWITSTYFSFVVLELLKKSTGFNYYFIYTIPALCLGIPYFWSKVKLPKEIRKSALLVHLMATVCFFVHYFPVGIFR